MAAGQQAISFDAIIKADRQKRKNEELANSILGKNRRTSAPGAGNKAQNASSGSLASRIGVAKQRSAPTATKPKKPTRTPSAPARVTPANLKPGKKRRPDEDRLVSALNPASGQAAVRDSPVGISIKGAGSGPFVVIGGNFAPGTTAADIQSAMEPITGQALSCWITSQYPAVTAEMAFSEKWAAESAIANFHNQRADGRIISMRMKQNGAKDHDLFDRSAASQSFNDFREQEDRKRLLHRGAEVQDGAFGFAEQNQAAGRNNRRNFRNRNAGRGGRNQNQASNDQGLYGDQMMVDTPPQGPRNRNQRQR
ncbi:hypothetical protein BDV25DRAFT_156726 [Aspergillus avenaceus]|uniref:RRM domain-containing protein n=1 Tax=Aspergillus avenaceus TaxID=36643 RepID=A0A5N6TSG4_ASPAV|nr:hypothetical protein BDV25DRAFT_156726 [Aspergillus avenaceus]